MVQVHIIVAPEDTIPFFVLFHRFPDTVPPRVFAQAGEFEGHTKMGLVPLLEIACRVAVMIRRVFVEGLVGQSDQSTVNNGEIDKWPSGEQVLEQWIHFKVLWDSFVNWVITVDKNLERGVVVKVQSKNRMS